MVPVVWWCGSEGVRGKAEGVVGQRRATHHNLRLLVNIRAPREARHVHKEVRRQPRDARLLRVVGVPPQRERPFNDRLREGLRGGSVVALEAKSEEKK